MKQLVILSGKGGTGKTSVTAAFAHLAHQQTVQAILADADVDAANLELVLAPTIQETHEFIGGSVAHIDPTVCRGCGRCLQACRFEAITMVPPSATAHVSTRPLYRVDETACEGCAACVYRCRPNAIHMEPQVTGNWHRADSRYGPLIFAALRPAQENSGKLVTQVKQEAHQMAVQQQSDVLLVDGPPGIGCPVIAAASGADLALIVAEPTLSGLHDLQRIIETTNHFRVPALVCINKADIYTEGAQQICTYCEEHDIVIVGNIPFDEAVQQAMIQGEPVTAWQPDAPASVALVQVWHQVLERLT